MLQQPNDEIKARYHALVKARQKTVERGYKCLCCRDTGLIPYDVIQRYHLAEGMMGDEYESVFRGEAGILCRATNCEGNETMITKPLQDGSSEEKMVDKFAEWAVDDSISADRCNWVHQQEWERWRSYDQQNMKSAAPPDMNRAVAAIAKPMPKPKLQESPEKPVLEHKGFCVGDVVMITLDAFDESDRRNIRKSGECPHEGKIGTIKRWDRETAMGVTAMVPVVEIDGSEWVGITAWLKPLEVAA